MAEVLPVAVPDGQTYFAASPLRRSASSQTSIFLNPNYNARRPPYPSLNANEPCADSASTSASSSSHNSQIDLTQPSSFASTTSSSLTLDTTFDVDDSLSLPTYGGAFSISRLGDEEPPPSPSTANDNVGVSPKDETATTTPEQTLISEDDTALKVEPSRHVDYLSHEWVEEDIWSSWRHIVSKRRIYGERSRLENASWRTWAKQKHKLRTVPPDTLNWLKDCDVTWLYGPLQTARSYSISEPTTEPASNLSKSNSFLNKKPILKKRSMSEVMLQKSLSSSSLVKQAAAAVQAQQLRPSLRHRPAVGRAQSDFSTITSRTMSTDTSDSYASSHSTSGLQTPDHGEKRHIRFDERVEQCIAVDVKDGHEDDEDEDPWAGNDDSDSSSDEGLVMMKSNKKRPLSRTASKTNISENRIIEKLEPTTLKNRTDSPDVPDHPSHSVGTSFWNRKGNLSPSPSQETLRPSNPSRNFLLAEEDDDDDISWEPSSAYPDRRDSKNAEEEDGYDADYLDRSSGMRRTESGMLMPIDDEEDPRNGGLIGRISDTVNTAKDIAHVIFNVGWRS